MSKNVYCKDCKWLNRDEHFEMLDRCTHPSVYVSITRHDPVYGIRVERKYKPGGLYNPYTKNADLSCEDFEEPFFIKLLKLIFYS